VSALPGSLGFMTTFVLVPGAWLGGFAWERVSSVLLDAGHDVRPVTLSGVGNRADDPDVTLQTHVDDIVTVIEGAGLRDVVLVGHSYSGIPVGQAALRVRDRVKHVVYVDANVPHDGESFADSWSDEGRAELLATLAANDNRWPPMSHDEFDGQGLTHQDIHLIGDWSKPHPGRTLTDPAQLTGDVADLTTTYVTCLLDGAEPNDDVKGLLSSRHWRLVELETGHWPMYSVPTELADVLLSVA